MLYISDAEKRLEAEIDELLAQSGGIRQALYGSAEAFNKVYQPWFTKARRVVTNLVPERLTEFDACYGKPGEQKHDIWAATLDLSDMATGRLEVMSPKNVWGQLRSQCEDLFRLQESILAAAQATLNSAIRDISAFLRAGLFDSDLESAEALAEVQLYRCAGVIAGVVLETHLSDVCLRRGITLPTIKPTLAHFNNALKSEKVIDIVVWRQIEGLGDLRNKCAHPNKGEPTLEDVRVLIEGVKLKIKQVF